MNILDLLFKKTFQKPKALTSEDRELARICWEHIEQLTASKSPSALRQAIVEADKLLELALKKLVNENQSLGENLKQAQNLFPSAVTYQQAWEAHKVRNALVHEAGFEPTQSYVKETLEKFRHILTVLRAL